jgi:hypothetical protein
MVYGSLEVIEMAKKTKSESKELTYKTPEMLAIEEETGFKLTLQQRRFAEGYAEGDRSARTAAIEAGYSAKTATQIASSLLNPKYHPQVVAYIRYIREDIEARYGVTKEGMLRRLHRLSMGAEEQGQFAAAINAEKIRASLGGLTIDRRETINSIGDMSREQVVARLEELRMKNPHVFDVIEGEVVDVTSEED